MQPDVLPWRPVPDVRPFAACLVSSGVSVPVGRSGSLKVMEQREEPAVVGTATEEERAQARARFRRKLAEAEARMTPEKRAEVRAALGLDAPAA
jgi:hypothetical protein